MTIGDGQVLRRHSGCRGNGDSTVETKTRGLRCCKTDSLTNDSGAVAVSFNDVSKTGTISATRRSRPPKSINVALFKYPHRWENFYTKVFDVNNYALSFKLIKISVFQIFECMRLRIESNSA